MAALPDLMIEPHVVSGALVSVLTDYPPPDAGLYVVHPDAKVRLPTKVDEFTTLVDVTYKPHKHVYWYVMEVKDGERVDRQKLKQSAQNQACGNADAVHLIREKGLSYEYHYTDRTRATLAAFTIANCP